MPRTNIDPLVEYALEALEEFREPSAWKRSKKGNLWRNWEGKTVSIFERDGDGYYGWCIADREGQRFSRHGAETEEDAMDDLAEALDVAGV